MFAARQNRYHKFFKLVPCGTEEPCLLKQSQCEFVSSQFVDPQSHETRPVPARNQFATTKELRISSSDRRAFFASSLSRTFLEGDSAGATSENEIAMRSS